MPHGRKWPEELTERLRQWRDEHPKTGDSKNGSSTPGFNLKNGSDAVVKDCIAIFERIDDPHGHFNGFDKYDKVSQQVLPFSNISLLTLEPSVLGAG